MTCQPGMVLSAVIAHPPSAAFKIMVLIWKDWLVAGAGWGMHPGWELAIPQHAGGNKNSIRWKVKCTHTHTHKSFKGKLSEKPAPNPDICTARGRGSDTSYPASHGRCLDPSDLDKAPFLDTEDKQAFQGTACLTCFSSKLQVKWLTASKFSFPRLCVAAGGWVQSQTPALLGEPRSEGLCSGSWVCFVLCS